MDPRVQRAIQLIGKNPANTIPAQNISRLVNLSLPRLRQLFKKETGLTLRQYVKRVRMENATKLLRTSFLTVKEITFQSGARDVSHFVRDFKEYYGLTPSEFRARNQEQ